MKINRQFQQRHAPTASVDWVMKQHVERDICLLYHQLANYSFVMGDLYYGSVFGLPYWEFLALPGLDERDARFIRDGCLVMMLAMASVCIDGSDACIIPHVSACLSSLDRLELPDDDTRRLVEVLRLALNLVVQGGPEPPELLEAYTWAHKRYVRSYFAERARDFATNAYFADPTS